MQRRSEVTENMKLYGFLCKQWYLARLDFSYSNSRRHSANADVIADVKSKIILSRQQFFADVIFSATSKVQNYQNKTGEKFKQMCAYYIFQVILKIYMLYSLSSANCKQLRKCNHLYRSLLFVMFFFQQILDPISLE